MFFFLPIRTRTNGVTILNPLLKCFSSAMILQNNARVLLNQLFILHHILVGPLSMIPLPYSCALGMSFYCLFIHLLHLFPIYLCLLKVPYHHLKCILSSRTLLLLLLFCRVPIPCTSCKDCIPQWKCAWLILGIYMGHCTDHKGGSL